MTLVQWTPVRGSRCARPVNYETKTRGSNVTSWQPATDIYDTESDYVFRMEVPGFAKEDVKVEFKDNVLTVNGERKEQAEVNDANYHRTERRSGVFSRSFRLPKNVDGKNIDAKLHKGILELRIAKPEERKTKTIPITFN
ncbi:MAG: Hsp20/alpha crystallin family protein [bacterium]|nr:Hsp20/alpha crystallin family protein [bacterium]